MLKFPVEMEMEERASWTRGAVVLIARNGGVKGCKGAVEPLTLEGGGMGETFGVVPKRIVPVSKNIGVSEVEFAVDNLSGPVDVGGGVSVVNFAARFAAVLFVLWIFVRRRFGASRAQRGSFGCKVSSIGDSYLVHTQ
jgi:hypothetical protein